MDEEAGVLGPSAGSDLRSLGQRPLPRFPVQCLGFPMCAVGGLDQVISSQAILGPGTLQGLAGHY